ncbi:hypothetical protein ACQKIE_19195 [Luteibacter sp. NPDC031894]|uniref:hypothetical protein n=1 Tax=Luteibacter sp. NPDC031894 TaxID=3390572 RepID=UPI003CFF4EF2
MDTERKVDVLAVLNGCLAAALAVKAGLPGNKWADLYVSDVEEAHKAVAELIEAARCVSDDPTESELLKLDAALSRLGASA